MKKKISQLIINSFTKKKYKSRFRMAMSRLLIKYVSKFMRGNDSRNTNH